MDRGLAACEEDLVEYVFHDIKARRAGILKALTAGNSTFYALIFSLGDAIFSDFWFFSCVFPLQILRISTSNAILALGDSSISSELCRAFHLLLYAILMTLRASEHQAKKPKSKHIKEEVEDLNGNNNNDDEDKHLCASCGGNDSVGDYFWICCDACEKWYHGKCVRVTPAKAKHIKKYCCPRCSHSKRRRIS
ncbi:hypothetical protein MUK42_15459 [Musa troglodytarum]|uniref:PHD finger protein ALFIN-LIKE n=1 Tax=Musa troglodytarum TaxID=320322 RepID=A0A9E7HSM1_9LILI|nr:hypothetical protein MUK42_15459 [Musa troglodytarum]